MFPGSFLCRIQKTPGRGDAVTAHAAVFLPLLFGLASLRLALTPGRAVEACSPASCTALSTSSSPSADPGCILTKSREHDTMPDNCNFCLKWVGVSQICPALKLDLLLHVQHLHLSLSFILFYFIYCCFENLRICVDLWLLSPTAPATEGVVCQEKYSLKASICAGFQSLPCSAGDVVKRQKSPIPGFGAARVARSESLLCTHSYPNTPKPQHAASAALALHFGLF